MNYSEDKSCCDKLNADFWLADDMASFETQYELVAEKHNDRIEMAKQVDAMTIVFLDQLTCHIRECFQLMSRVSRLQSHTDMWADSQEQ